MGAGISSVDSTEGDGGVPRRRKLDDIPECCIALVLGHLDPPEICSVARLNRAFHGASSADFIWETKLPTNYPFIIQKILPLNDKNGDHGVHEQDYDHNKQRKVVHGSSFTKKDLYAHLAKHNFFDDGTKEIWLDKSTGGVCLSISSKALSITGIDDRRYWNHIPSEESRFQTVAYLVQIWWFEVCGKLDFKFPTGTYNLFFRIQLGKSSKRFGRKVCNLEHIHGWELRPIRFQLTTSDGQQAVSQHYIDNAGCWMLYHGGDFVIKDPNKETKIKFSARQVDCTHIKGGLSLDSVVICPKNLGKEVESFL